MSKSVRKIQKMKTISTLLISAILCQCVSAQKRKVDSTNTLIPFTGILWVPGYNNPFSFLAGVQKPVYKHLTAVADIHYWKTNYENYSNGMYSKGRFTTITPSVKLIYNTGKHTGKGFYLGFGLGYMFVTDKNTGQPNYNSEINRFGSLSFSVNFGFGFRIYRLPVSINNSYYIANDGYIWGTLAGGSGIIIGLKRLD